MNNLYRTTNHGIKLKNEMSRFFKYEQSQPFNLFATLNAFENYDIETLQARAQKWNRDIESRLFRGKKYQKILDEYFKYWGFSENTKSNNPHYHLLVYITPQRIDWFKKIAPKIWSKKVPSGQCHIVDIRDCGGIDYVLKALNKPFGYSNYIVSGEFGRKTIH